MNFRFRIYNKETSNWHGLDWDDPWPYYNFALFGETTLLMPPKLEDLNKFVVERYIGLDDFDDNPVFEGDYITFKYCDISYTGEVKWSGENASFKAYMIDDHCFSFEDIMILKVVGNIHNIDVPDTILNKKGE